LPERHVFGQDVVHQVRGPLCHSSSEARGTEATAAATERHELALLAARARQQREASTKHAAGNGCQGDKKTTVSSVEQALSARVATPVVQSALPPPPAPSAKPKEIVVPGWVEDYAGALCKRVATCREKMLSALPEQQKMMLSMQIPTQEACLKNTHTFKERAPKAELDDSEKKALASCLREVPATACGNIQTGKVPECQTIAALIAEAQGRPSESSAAPSR
jgi:hypothetical protein